MEMQGLIAAALIVKNEEAMLPACLRSVYDYVDQIVVVDTGSTDGTMQIARDFGAVTGYFPWCQDFAAARNAALDLCTTDWVLSIDADERLLTGKALTKLTMTRPICDPKVPIYGLKIANASDRASQENRTSFWGLRLFPRHPMIRWTRRIHERLTHLDGDEFMVNEFRPEIKLLHLGYTDAMWGDGEKAKRNVRLALLSLRSEPDDASMWMDLGRAHYQEGEFLSAVPALQRSLTLIRQQGLQIYTWTAVVYLLLIGSLCTLRRAPEALRIAEEALRSHPKHAGIANNLGLALLDVGEPKQALDMFQRSWELSRQPSIYETDDALGEWRAHLNMGNAYKAMGELVLAVEQYRKAMSAENGIAEPALNAGSLLLALGEAGEAEPYAQQVMTRWPNDPRAQALLERIETIRRERDAS